MGTVLSDQIRALARNALERGDITRNVKDDLCILARNVEEVERERDERCVVTMDEHGRVVDVYIDLLNSKAIENERLREERDKWRQDYERLMQERIANVGAGVTPTYHATESVEEAKAVVEQVERENAKLVQDMLDKQL